MIFKESQIFSRFFHGFPRFSKMFLPTSSMVPPKLSGTVMGLNTYNSMGWNNSCSYFNKMIQPVITLKAL